MSVISHCKHIAASVIAAANPTTCVLSSLTCEYDRDGQRILGVRGRRHVLAPDAELFVCGVGKAAASMILACLDVCGSTCGAAPLVVTKYGHVSPSQRAALTERGAVICEAGHPQPDDAGVAAADLLLRRVTALRECDTFMLLLSGGGSALLPAPAAGLSLRDLQDLNATLLGSGASIQDVNTVRKHCSRIAGGRLASACAGSVLSLVLSDVIGDDTESIASGPTVTPTTTAADALDVLVRYRLLDAVPRPVLTHLRAAASVSSPSHTHTHTLTRVRITTVVGSNASALRAAADAATRCGYTPHLLTSRLDISAAAAGRMLAAAACEAAAGTGMHRAPAARGVAIICGGETTVSLDGATGTGGRNQELALSAAIALFEYDVTRRAPGGHIAVASLGTDGTDGPTDAAGAVATHATVTTARDAAEARAALARHDSYTFFRAFAPLRPDDGDASDASSTSGLFMTGPTGTNVMDVMWALVQFA